MILVPDASALAEYLLKTPAYPRIRPFVEDDRVECHVPALCDVEIVSVLRGSLLGGRLTVERAEEALETYRELPLIRHDHLLLVPRIFELRQNFSAYDACYVALCESLGGRLLTGDRHLQRAVVVRLELDVVSLQE